MHQIGLGLGPGDGCSVLGETVTPTIDLGSKGYGHSCRDLTSEGGTRNSLDCVQYRYVKINLISVCLQFLSFYF